MIDPTVAPTCPECGFRVFNRRFPKCESCGAALPESIVYSPVERQTLLVADEQRALEKARGETSGADATHASFDESVLSALMGLTES